MKTNILILKLLAALVLFNIFSCKSQYTKWENNKTISNIEYEKIRYKLNKQDTVLIIGMLKKETKIGNFICAKDWVYLTKDFKLQLFKLARPFSIEKYTLVKDTWVSLKRNGRYICVLPKDTLIQGRLCMGGSGIDDITVSFETDGTLRSFFTPDDIKIERVFCSGGDKNEIGLLKSGALEYCTLSIDHNINDTKYRQGSVVYFDNNGNVSIVKTK
jgi:hypothetical protein